MIKLQIHAILLLVLRLLPSTWIELVLRTSDLANCRSVLPQEGSAVLKSQMLLDLRQFEKDWCLPLRMWGQWCSSCRLLEWTPAWCLSLSRSFLRVSKWQDQGTWPSCLKSLIYPSIWECSRNRMLTSPCSSHWPTLTYNRLASSKHRL